MPTVTPQPTPTYPLALLMAHIPRWLYDRLIVASHRQGTGHSRIVGAALERHLRDLAREPAETPPRESERYP